MDFINDGNNLIFATNENIGDGLRLFAEGVGIDFETGKSLVVDHFSFDSYSDPSHLHASILSNNTINSEIILGKYYFEKDSSPILYRGISHKVESENIFAVKVIKTLHVFSFIFFFFFLLTTVPHNLRSFVVIPPPILLI